MKLARAAGVKLTMRSLRRGFGCKYAGKGSAHFLQKLMRHANIPVTLDYYFSFGRAVEEAVLGKKDVGTSTRGTTGSSNLAVRTDSGNPTNERMAVSREDYQG
jgi:hypothetical protein